MSQGSSAGIVWGIGAALAAVVVGVALTQSKPARAATPTAPQPTPPASPTTTTTLQPGHRYSVTQLAPIPGAPIASVAQAQAMFDMIAPGSVRVVSVTPASGSTPTTLVVDVVKGIPMTVPATMPVTDLGPSPAAQPQPSFTAVVSDPNAVRQYQAILANRFQNEMLAPQLGLTPADYTQTDVDGNPYNPRWQRALAAFQAFINAKPIPAGVLPAGFPDHVRTDGVLDYATALIIANA